MKNKIIAFSALAVALAASAAMTTAKAYASPLAQPAAGLSQDRDRPWDQAPDEFRDVQRRGFHDGVEAARHDFEHRSHKDADDHDAYRHPRVERELRDDYREGFKRGYEAASNHMREEHRDHDHDDH